MSYQKQNWEELPSEETPFSAERMNHIEDGIDSKLDKMVVSKELNKAGWYRVARINSYDGTNALSAIFNINSNYYAKGNISATLIVSMAYQKFKISLLNCIVSDNNVIPKIRLVKDTNGIYLEIYFNYDLDNALNWVFVEALRQNTKDSSQLSMLDFEAPTDTATVLDELSIGETEGTWIPTLNYANVTYTYQNGRYRRVGDLVFFHFQIRGNITEVLNEGYSVISGLPYSAGYPYQAAILDEWVNCLNEDSSLPPLKIEEKEISIQKTSSKGGSVNKWAVNNSFYLNGSGFYITNE